MSDASSVFTRVLESEPEFSLEIDPALVRGARRRLRNRVIGAGTTGVVVAAAGAVVLTLPATPRSAAPVVARPAPQLASLTSASAYAAAVRTGGAPSTELEQLVQSSSPQGVTFDWTGPRTSPTSLDGTAADASGPGAFFISVLGAGNPPYPCTDYEKAALSCTETSRDGFAVQQMEFRSDISHPISGRRLELEGSQPMSSVDVSISLPDGRAVIASSANYVVTEDDAAPPVLHSDRMTSTLTLAQLTDLAIAVAKDQLTARG